MAIKWSCIVVLKRRVHLEMKKTTKFYFLLTCLVTNITYPFCLLCIPSCYGQLFRPRFVQKTLKVICCPRANTFLCPIMDIDKIVTYISPWNRVGIHFYSVQLRFISTYFVNIISFYPQINNYSQVSFFTYSISDK